MNSIKNHKILLEYFSLKGSTTEFINFYSDMDVKVRVLEQHIFHKEIIRKSILYTKTIDDPILFASGVFYLDKIPKNTAKLLANSEIPLGYILGPKNLRKENDSISISNNITLLDRLKSSQKVCYIRSFDLVYNNNQIAELNEALNMESLHRMFL